MLKNVSMQLKLMLSAKSFRYALFFSCVFSCIAFIINCLSTFGRPLTDVPKAYFYFIGSYLSEAFYYVFSTLLPILCVVVFSDSYYRDRTKNTLPVLLMRTSPEKYYFSKGIAVFASGFVVVFVSLFINYMLCFITFPINKGCDFTMFPTYYSDFFINGSWSDGILMEELFALNPYLYNFLFLIFTSLTGGVYAAIVYNISYFTIIENTNAKRVAIRKLHWYITYYKKESQVNFVPDLLLC